MGRESEGGHCKPPTLTVAKGHLEEEASLGFGPTRKRLLCPKVEPEDTEEGERVSHPEKRARISMGENFFVHASSLATCHSHFPLVICFLCISLILPTFPFIWCDAELSLYPLFF